MYLLHEIPLLDIYRVQMTNTKDDLALTEFLQIYRFPVEPNYVLETGFRSVVGKSDVTPHVAVLCEYDALPEIGHACGHNLIAEVGVGAAIGIKAALEAARDKGQDIGKV